MNLKAIYIYQTCVILLNPNGYFTILGYIYWIPGCYNRSKEMLVKVNITFYYKGDVLYLP